jgi:hypothetical protein
MILLMISTFPMMLKTGKHRFGLALLLTFLPVIAFAQDADPLSAVHTRLQDHRRLAQDHAVVFAGEISQMQTIPRTTCKAGVEDRIAYRVAETLWVEPDSKVRPGYTVAKDFIDCREKQLPAPPFAVGVRVLVYCGVRRGFNCLPPVELTDRNLHEIRTWLDDLRREEGNPALLQVHEALRQSAALLQKRGSALPPMINGEAHRPFLFVGHINDIEKLPEHPVFLVAPRLHMDIAVSQILWGDFKEPLVRAWCNSLACGGAESNEKVILHCYATSYIAECTAPAPYSDDSLKKVASWVTELGQR